MSELIDNAAQRQQQLKQLMMKLHEGSKPEDVRNQLLKLMGEIPYEDVVKVEQDLLSQGMSQQEILQTCDIHAAALRGAVQQPPDTDVPDGHPVHTFLMENDAVKHEIGLIQTLIQDVEALDSSADAAPLLLNIQGHCHALMDIDKHYQRKENLLFPFLEKHGITGPSTVMWQKDDNVRDLLKQAIVQLNSTNSVTADEAVNLITAFVQPAVIAIEDMMNREEQILFPMGLEKLNDAEWYQIATQSLEYGFCLYDPSDSWRPDSIEEPAETENVSDGIRLPSGKLTPQELNAILNTIPFDLTFVDKDDTVRYFTQGKERIFARSRAILGRKVQLCHPPASAHIVEQILKDFKSGKQDHAPFWINMHGKFIHIEYFALRDTRGEYLGTLEVSQDLTRKRQLEGEQRILNYGDAQE